MSRRSRSFASLLASPLLLLVLLASVQSANAQSAGAGGAQKTRVVMQVSDNDEGKWNLAMGNARNLQKGLGAANVDIEIEIVVFGPGIGMLKAASPVAARVREAKADGIALNACENTMAGQDLAKKDMNPAAGYVPSGVVEIVRKQQAGYAYLRP